MATSLGCVSVDRLTIFSMLYLPLSAFEECYVKRNIANHTHLRKLTCPGSCCGSTDYDKYCCGHTGNTLQQADNDTSLVQKPLSEKAVGTIVGGVIVFLAMVGGVIACCFCKPSCVPEQRVGSHAHQHPISGRHRSVTTKNPAFSQGILNPGYSATYPPNTLHGQQWMA